MRWLMAGALALCWLTWSPGSVALGQIVRVGPSGDVHVRAPFVRVDVGPDGRTSVRAPFTAVDVPGRRYAAYGPQAMARVPERASVAHGRRPTLADPALADWAALWRMLDSGTIRLDEQLGSGARASGWKKYLETARLRETLAEQDNGPPDPQTAEQLRDILARYEQTSAMQQYRSVTSGSGFRMVHAALKELVSPPLQRDRRLLRESAEDLERELFRLNNGRSWVRHLQLPEETLGGQTGAPQHAPPPSGTDLGRGAELGPLIEALARFDAISRDPRYRVIAGLPAFQTTHQRLGDYVHDLSTAQPGDPSRPPQVEVLPAPQPDPQ